MFVCPNMSATRDVINRFKTISPLGYCQLPDVTRGLIATILYPITLGFTSVMTIDIRLRSAFDVTQLCSSLGGDTSLLAASAQTIALSREGNK